VSWSVHGNNDLNSISIYTSIDNGVTFEFLELLQDQSSYQWTLPEVLEGVLHGVMIKVEAIDDDGITISDTHDRPFAIAGDNLSTIVPAGWNLWGSPVKPTESNLMDDNLDDDYENAYYVAYNFNDNGYYLAHLLYDNMGYWLGTTVEAEVDVEGIISETDVTKELTPGWTLITNPILYPVSVDSLIFDNGVDNPIFYSEAKQLGWVNIVYSYDEIEGYNEAMVLKPWHAYWLAVMEEDIMVTFPFHVQTEDELVNQRENAWYINFTASISGAADNLLTIGSHEDASDLFDVTYDKFSPPVPPSPDQVSLTVSHPEWNNAFEDKYKKDIRSLFSEGTVKQWNIDVHSSSELVNVSWDFQMVPNEYEVMYSTNYGQTFSNMRNIDVLTLAPNMELIVRVGANDAPEGVGSSVTIEEDNILISVLEAVDVENDPVTFNFVDIKNGTVDLNSDNGAYIYTPNLDFNGLDTLTFTASDGVDTGQEAHIFIEVIPVNDAPYFTSDMLPPIGLNIEFKLPLFAEDIDSDQLTLSLTPDGMNPTWLILEENNLSGIADQPGVFPVYLTLSDGEASVVDTLNLHVEHFSPQIISIRDIPNDQGGRVYLEFKASFFDNRDGTGQSYNIYIYDFIEEWIILSSVATVGDSIYTYEATTLTDSTSENNGMTEFKVVASMSGGIFHSEPMMGYSVDNILPGVPDGVMASIADNAVELSWNESVDEDFHSFVIEKSIMDMIEIIETADAFYVDENYISNEVHFYRVAAVDHAGNQSEFSEVVEVAVLAINNQVTPDVFALHQNYPNPFNPTTQIKYDLVEDAFVSISIYNVMGSRIKSLMNAKQSTGYHSLRWDATNNIGEAVSAGMYIYTIQAGQYRATKKMVLLK
jgi:hypothetical protein